MDIKKLKALAKACREAGIKSFKNEEFEITLSESFEAQPKSYYKRKKAEQAQFTDYSINPVESDKLSEEAMMFWSAGVGPGNEIDAEPQGTE